MCKRGGGSGDFLSKYYDFLLLWPGTPITVNIETVDLKGSWMEYLLL
jgi:hypothetical protein